jgi:hypothetical protein
MEKIKIPYFLYLICKNGSKMDSQQIKESSRACILNETHYGQQIWLVNIRWTIRLPNGGGAILCEAYIVVTASTMAFLHVHEAVTTV